MSDLITNPTAKLGSNTGLKVRDDLYDEAYSDDEYEAMLSMYEGTMAAIVGMALLILRRVLGG